MVQKLLRARLNPSILHERLCSGGCSVQTCVREFIERFVMVRRFGLASLKNGLPEVDIWGLQMTALFTIVLSST